VKPTQGIKFAKRATVLYKILAITQDRSKQAPMFHRNHKFYEARVKKKESIEQDQYKIHRLTRVTKA
jgi:hypothetical protein